MKFNWCWSDQGIWTWPLMYMYIAGGIDHCYNFCKAAHVLYFCCYKILLIVQLSPEAGWIFIWLCKALFWQVLFFLFIYLFWGGGQKFTSIKIELSKKEFSYITFAQHYTCTYWKKRLHFFKILSPESSLIILNNPY